MRARSRLAHPASSEPNQTAVMARVNHRPLLAGVVGVVNGICFSCWLLLPQARSSLRARQRLAAFELIKESKSLWHSGAGLRPALRGPRKRRSNGCGNQPRRTAHRKIEMIRAGRSPAPLPTPHSPVSTAHCPLLPQVVFFTHLLNRRSIIQDSPKETVLSKGL